MDPDGQDASRHSAISPEAEFGLTELGKSLLVEFLAAARLEDEQETGGGAHGHWPPAATV
jgi:hypothetical protein